MNGLRSFAAALLGVMLLTLGVTHAIAAAADEPVRYAVLVHPENKHEEPDDKARIQLLKRLYLRTISQWPGGEEAKPFARAPDSPERKATLKALLGMNQAELSKHWIDLKQKDGTTSPREIERSSMAIKMVERYKGAFCIVTLAEADEVIEKAKAAGEPEPRIFLKFEH